MTLIPSNVFGENFLVMKVGILFRYRDRDIGKKIIGRLKGLGVNATLMHVCGTHQDTLVRYGLEPLLRQCGIDIRQGPGCPVCVTTPREIEEGVLLAKKGKVLATYGDMVRVPGRSGSLEDLRSEGCVIKVVYSISDALKMAKETEKETVFMAVGFETTAPSTAATILEGPPENFSILNCHRYVPPALKTLIEMGEVKIQGLIEPGHVSAIIGMDPYISLSEKYRMPQVIVGFEPLDLLMGVYMLVKQIVGGISKVENEYVRAVKPEGNLRALKALSEVFTPFDLEWRGFPVIPSSGMELRSKYEGFDARKVFEDDLKGIRETKFETPEDCKCDEILRGLIRSHDCALFAEACTPQHPVGPCMVSSEGSCNIEYTLGAHLKKLRSIKYE